MNRVKAAGNHKVTSTSDQVEAEAEMRLPVLGQPGELVAFAHVPDGVKGRAAAEAVDPYSLDPGLYRYSYTIEGAELLTSQLDDFAGIDFFATDSRFSDPLWYLGVVANGPIASRSDLQISFVSNPILGLDDSLIADRVRNAFSVSSGSASLSSFTLFDTTYAIDRTTIYADGVGAGVENAVPEPSSLVLLLTACVVAGPLVRRRRGE